MARYKTVEVRIWSDAKFATLDPDGKLLFLHLLTSPRSSIIPGVILAGPAGVAESMGISLERLRIPFRDIQAMGMARVSHTHPITYLPTAIRHNPPANLNVLKAWIKIWPDIPECELKAQISQDIKPYAERYGDGYAEQFPEPITIPITIPRPIPRPRKEAPSLGEDAVDNSGSYPQASPHGDTSAPTATTPPGTNAEQTNHASPVPGNHGASRPTPPAPETTSGAERDTPPSKPFEASTRIIEADSGQTSLEFDSRGPSGDAARSTKTARTRKAKKPGQEGEGLSELKLTIACFDEHYKHRSGGAPPTWGAKQVSMLKRLLKQHGYTTVCERIERLFTSPPKWIDGMPDVPLLVSQFDKLAAVKVFRSGESMTAEQFASAARGEVEIEQDPAMKTALAMFGWDHES